MKCTGPRFLLLCSVLSFAGLALLHPGTAGAQGSTTSIVWQAPVAVPFGTPLSDVQLNAVALAGPPVQVPLASSYNILGITTNGYSFLGGFDYDSWSYSAELVGPQITWQGVPFAIGPSNVNDVVSSETIPLPQGSFGKLLMLGDIVNDQQPPVATFTVNYTDGTSTTVQQSMSDWVIPQNYPGESLAACYPARQNLDGSTDHNSVCAYGYQITLDPTKTVASLVLPNDRDVVMISFTLLPPEVQGTMTYSPAAGAVLPSGSQTLYASFTPANPAAYSSASASVPLTVTPLAKPLTPTIAWPTPQPIAEGTPLSAVQLNAAAVLPVKPTLIPLATSARVNALYDDVTIFEEKGFDGSGLAYSANLLGSSLSYAGGIFPLGPLAVPDAAEAATIALPAGNYATLYLVGAGANGPQTNQVFTLNYADGTTSAGSISLSSWTQSQNFAGETLVASTSYADTAAGGQMAGTYNVYGYQVPVDATKVVTSVTMPANPNVILLAMGLGSQTTASVAGSYLYTPPVDTVLPLGQSPLAVAFQPTDGTDFTAASGSNSILVVPPTLTVTANNASRTYGTPNPMFTGTITGAKPGDSFSESFGTTATTQSPAGTYAIVPVASGADLAAYSEVVLNGTLTVAKAPVTEGVTTNTVGILEGQPATLTATVASTTIGVPTGTVHFVTGGVVVGTANVVNGVATLTTQALPIGSDVVTALYSGDQNFLGAAASVGGAITVTSPDFTFTAVNGTVMNVTWGQSASLMLHVAPLSTVYVGNVQISLSSTLPPQATAAFSPSLVSANAGPQDVMFTYNSRLLSQASDWPMQNRLPKVPIACGLLLLPLAVARRRWRQRWVTGLCALLLAIAVLPAISGCGSGYQSGNFPLVVTATDGVHVHTLTLTLKLNTSAQVTAPRPS